MMTTNRITIRAMVRGDFSRITALSAQLGYPITMTELDDRFEVITLSSDHRVAVAEMQGQIVGWCHVFCVRLIESEGYAELGGIVVDDEYRRRGVGRSLILDAERWAIAHGFGRLRAYSGHHREAAHMFYLQMGYTQRETAVFQKTIR